MIKISPKTLVIQESIFQQMLVKNFSDQIINIELRVEARSTDLDQHLVSYPDAFLLDTYSLILQPEEVGTVKVQFIPLTADIYQTARIIIMSGDSKFQSPILGIQGVQSCIYQQNKIINNGSCPLVIKIEDQPAKILNIQEMMKSSQDILYWPVYAQRMQIEGTMENILIKQFCDPLEFMQKCVLKPKVKEMIAHAVGSELMETMEYSEAVLPVKVILQDKNDTILLNQQPALIQKDVTLEQNETLQKPNYITNNQIVQQKITDIVNSPQNLPIIPNQEESAQNNTIEYSGQQLSQQNIKSPEQIVYKEGSYQSYQENLSNNEFTNQSAMSQLSSKNIPQYILDQYQQELQELNALEQQLQSDVEELDQDKRYNIKNYIYETEVIPDFMPISVQYADGPLYYTPQNLMFVNEIPIYPILMQNTFWRLLNSQFLLSTPKFPPYSEKITEKSTVQILYLTGQIHIMNTSHQTGFYQKISNIYPNCQDEVAQTVENMSYLYYNLDFITQVQDYSTFRLNIKSDSQLSGRLAPNENKILNITFAITVTNVENDQLPEVPQLFQNMMYNNEKDIMESITPLFVRVTGFRFDRYYTDEEFDCLPTFYQDQNDDEIRESIDVPVVFPKNLVVDRKVEKSVILKQLRYPEGDLRVNQNLGKVTQAFNIQYFDFLKTVPVIGLNDIIHMGTLKLKNQLKTPKVVEQADKLKKLDKYLANNKQGGVMSFSPVSNNKKSAKSAKTPKHNDIFIENTETASNNKFELEKSFPIIFKKKSVDFKQISVSEIEIYSFPTNLPRCSEQIADFPVLSHAFTCSSTSLKVKTSTLFLSDDYVSGYVDFKLKLSQQSVDSIIKSLSCSERIPIFLEQQFQLEIKSDSKNSAVLVYPLLVMAELDLDEFQFNFAQNEPTGTNIAIKNAIQGINMRQINGFVEEVFTTTQILKIQPVFYMSKTTSFLQIFNGSGRHIVAFTQGSAPPFKCVNTFQIAGNSSFKQQIEFAPKKPGKYEFDMKIQWPDISKVKETQQGVKGVQRYHSLNVKIVAIAVNVPLLLRQGTDDFPKSIKVSKYQFSMLYIQNISDKNAKFTFECDKNINVSPVNGVVENGASAVVRIWWEGEKKPCRVKVIGECFGSSGVVFEGVAEPE